MKKLNIYINERLLISPDNYIYYPETKTELQQIIELRIKNEGNDCDLNDIDVSGLKDLSHLFSGYFEFNGDIYA